ncbi:MAG: DUF429 domain-containing protein [Gemmatimonadetes bacterium]|nr:DUF429 domain-containing protein [Gemmatimonadota bacterium]
MILSVDLAAARYADNGIALLTPAPPGRVHAHIVPPASLGLSDPPHVEHFADALLHLARTHDVRGILIDGPQAWRRGSEPLPHARVCELATRTPGKTGPPGVVKPRTWTRMAEFSIALFDALDARGFPRLDATWTDAPFAVESFPTHAWRMLGRAALPAKRRRGDWTPWQQHLEQHWLSAPLGAVTHDELQAVVAGIGGVQLVRGGVAAAHVCGEPPVFESGSWREGFIVSPRAQPTPYLRKRRATVSRRSSSAVSASARIASTYGRSCGSPQ